MISNKILCVGNRVLDVVENYGTRFIPVSGSKLYIKQLRREKLSNLRSIITLFLIYIVCIFGLVLSLLSFTKVKLFSKFANKSNDIKNESFGKDAQVSVIIAAHNEALVIKHTIEQIIAAAHGRVEILVVDASSTDKTASIVRDIKLHRGDVVTLRMIHSPSGRGVAFHAGASQARGEILCFLHSDCILPSEFDTLLRTELTKPSVLATAFEFDVNREELDSHNVIGLETMSVFANLRSRICMLPYGDQAFSLTKAQYDTCGGFPPLKMMEDFEFIGKVRRVALENHKEITILSEKSQCSPRRWEKNGVLKNTILNQVFVLAYNVVGFSPEKIYSLYYRRSS